MIKGSYHETIFSAQIIQVINSSEYTNILAILFGCADGIGFAGPYSPRVTLQEKTKMLQGQHLKYFNLAAYTPLKRDHRCQIKILKPS